VEKAILNHEEMIKQFAKTCSSIADLLPRTELTLILYPTELMKEAVALLYSRILIFFKCAIRWYKQGKLAHVWTAISRPWSATFKDHVETIAEQARRVEQLSSAAAKTELRETHLEVMETRAELQLLSNFVKSEFHRLLQLSLSKNDKNALRLRCNS
jgi:hypothetical protein